MTQITNQRPYPLTIEGQTAGPGETINVDHEIAESALEQPDNWAKADETTCVECGYQAKSARGLATHLRTHEDEEDPTSAGDGEKES